MNIRSSTRTVPYLRDAAEIVPAEIHEHDVLGAFLLVRREFLRQRIVFRFVLPRGRVPAIGR